MYNIDYESRIRRFLDDLFRSGCAEKREASREASLKYSLPNNIETIACEEDSNNELVPSKVQ